jgi:hypothetical protein
VKVLFSPDRTTTDRHGYECPEERDYYPYWHPSEIWRDIAILTNDTDRCPAWQAESQNVKERYYCKVPQSYIDSMVGTDPTQMNQRYGFIPITQAGCESSRVGGTWTRVESWGIAAPKCEKAPWTRDNHLGNTYDGEAASWNWTIPIGYDGKSCVFRLRYNITTRETRDAGEWESDTSVQCGKLNSTLNYKYIPPPNGIQIDNDNNDVTAQNPKFFKYADQLDVWSKYGLSKLDSEASFDPVLFYNNQPTRGYVFRNDPVVDIFGSLLPSATPQVFLRLSLDTSQYGRTFEDRSHTFTIRKRPGFLENSVGKIWNVGVRGKRGNIVQTYPGVEYDFVPNQLWVEQGDWIHFQWQGSNTNPGNNAGQGTAGTDRSNIVVLNKFGRQYAPQEVANLRGPFKGDGMEHASNWKLSYPSRIDSDVDFLGLTKNEKRGLALGGIYSPYFDYKPVQVKNVGIFNYLCTRNNAFTNRGQKAQIIVTPVADAAARMVVADTSSARFISASGASWIRFAPDPNGITTNTQIYITELEDGRILVEPLLFDVVPGQMVMLDMTYTERPMTDVYIYQSDFEDYNGNEQATNADGGVATVRITRGGYYHVEQQVAASSVAGVVIGVVAFVGLLGFGYYKLNQKFHIRDKKYIAANTAAIVP